MKILLVGSGGREHALAWKLVQSEGCEHLFVAPGSDAIDMEPKASCTHIATDNLEEILAFTAAEHIDLVVVGPEAPLVAGLADTLRAQGVAVFGPSQKAAQLEGSKGFMKDLCKKYDIPTAAYERFSDFEKAKTYIEKQAMPLVIKADGLAAGKGVIIAQNHEEAIETAKDMLSGNAFGDAGAEVVIEEFLEGEEVSFFAIADGKTVLPLSSAQDHKRAYDNDEGPNTGGMGAYSPARAQVWDEAKQTETMERVILPTIRAMEEEDCAYTGVLYAGLMMVKGKPYLIEYNVRFGDPECQPLMMRLESDLATLLYDAATKNLERWTGKIKWHTQAALCVVMAAEGYPGSYPKDTTIDGVDAVANSQTQKIFHAGTKRGDGGWFSTGGRVLGVTALGSTIVEARKTAYDMVSQISWPQGFYRKDIGNRALDKAEAA